ncbi:MAG: DUF1622 domain-containing protein [Polyangiaceae bacterium]|nr:DUF1622 domain-containing protein [Polyangiaceae bacterium]
MTLQPALEILAEYVALVIEIVAVATVGYGSLEAVFRAGRHMFGSTAREWKLEVWRGFGVWLVLGLEFALAADIVRTVIAPTWRDIGQLAAIAAIRTVLNYFLAKDLATERVEEQLGAAPVTVPVTAASRRAPA